MQLPAPQHMHVRTLKRIRTIVDTIQCMASFCRHQNSKYVRAAVSLLACFWSNIPRTFQKKGLAQRSQQSRVVHSGVSCRWAATSQTTNVESSDTESSDEALYSANPVMRARWPLSS